MISCLVVLGFPSGTALAEVPAQFANFLDKHCSDCHSGAEADVGFRVDTLGFQLSNSENHGTWVKVFDRVRTGEMPPSDSVKPATSEVTALVESLKPLLLAAEEARYASEGRATIRRLSREEHIYALKDLLHLPGLTAGDKLPPDSLTDGFGKSSAALPFSHIQVDRYLEVADDAVRAAMAPQRKKPVAKRVRVDVSEIRGQTFKQTFGNSNGQETLILSKLSNFLYGSLKSGSAIPVRGSEVDQTFQSWTGDFSTRTPGYVLDEPPYIDGVGVLSHDVSPMGRDFKATCDGKYRLRVDAFSFKAQHGKVVPTERTEVVAFYSDTRLLGHLDVTPMPRVQEVDVWLNEGESVSICAASLPLWRIEPKDKKSGLRYPVVDVPAVAFRALEMEGPLLDSWPPESHKRLFGDLPLAAVPESTTNERDYEVTAPPSHEDAVHLLESFAAAAYRRAPEPVDMSVPLSTFARHRQDGNPFEESLLAAYAAVLSSPGFVLVPMDAGPLPPKQLADRLSLFLWTTPADEGLHNATADVFDGGQVNQDRLADLVETMIDDPRIERFVAHFADHWLDLQNIGTTEPDENLYNGFSPWLQESMLAETRAYVRAMLREDLPARSVIDSDFIFANGALAELYGVNGAVGGKVQRVSLSAESVRGGLLTQASVLKVSANGTTTSPVVRGVYVMDRLLGQPPPPPPEAVPAVEPDLSGATTIRELLAAHREDEACAACHKKIDPPGFALEAFDVMGRFRERYHSLKEGTPVDGITRRAKPIQYRLGRSVDTAGELAEQPFKNIDEFRHLVLNDERAIARNLLERLTVYATGAPIGISDRATIESILDQTAETGFGMRSMIVSLATSSLFLNK